MRDKRGLTSCQCKSPLQLVILSFFRRAFMQSESFFIHDRTWYTYRMFFLREVGSWNHLKPHVGSRHKVRSVKVCNQLIQRLLSETVANYWKAQW